MSKNSLPDVAKETNHETLAPLDWVGMGGIELPILLAQKDLKIHVPSRVEAKVSLDKNISRGIHMSRLYLICQELLSKNDLTLSLLAKVTNEFLKTHLELSTKALVKVQFEAPLLRKALKSENSAWRSYPVVLSCENDLGVSRTYVEVEVTYSSTCPASAALSRQLIQEEFKRQFSGTTLSFEKIESWLGTSQGMIATPHAQRSVARVKVEVAGDFNFENLISLVEESLQTAVQGAVKREDEQEFALRNGQNLMFCEDAARRVKVSLDRAAGILDYVGEFKHFESLHPHNAESSISKGVRLRNF